MAHNNVRKDKEGFGIRDSLKKTILECATKIFCLIIGDTSIERFGLLPMGAEERAKKLGFGDRTRIYPMAIVYGSPKVGKNVFISPYAVIDGTGPLTIGDNCQIGSYSMIWTHDTVEWCLLRDDVAKGKLRVKGVTIENNVWIATGVIVTPGVHIGHHSIIAAGSIVTKDVPPYSVVAGVPAKVVRSIVIDGDEIRYNPPKNN